MSSFRILHLIMVRVFGWPGLLSRGQASRNAEIMVPRHEVMVLRCQTVRARRDWAGRAVLSALAQLLPTALRQQAGHAENIAGLVPSPDHPQVCVPSRPGPPGPPVQEIRGLLLRLAARTPPGDTAGCTAS